MEDSFISTTVPISEVAEEAVVPPVFPVYTPPVRKKFPILMSLLLIILAFVAAICVYLFVQIRTLNTQLTGTPTPLPTPVASVDPFSDWDIFTHPTQNYSVRFPSSLQIRVDKETPGNSIFVTSDNLDNIIGGVEVRELKITPEQWINSQKKSGIIITKEQTQKTLFSSGIKIKASSAMDFYAYIFTHNDMLYIVSLNITSEDDEKLFDQIISKFQFTDVSSSPTSYTCPKGEWVDCMPTPDAGVRLECSPEYMSWATKNCPGFKGGAL